MIEDRIARVQSGRFTVVRKLGEGGMGVVYEVIDAHREARVALKTLLDDAPAEVLRLKNEFRRCTGILHRNLVELYELFASDDTFFFTMELVEGTSLLDYCRPGGVRDESRCRSVLLQLTDGVDALHSAGVLHRDIKPSNVLVDGGDRLVVLDFGLALPILSADAGTLSVQPAGTVAYMSPEQCRIGSSKLTAASDWYSVGALLYQVLTGRPPFSGTALEVMQRKAQEDVAPPGNDVAPELSDVCMRLLARRAEDRANGAALRGALQGQVSASADTSSAVVESTVFAGRTEELSRLEVLFARTQNGESLACYIEGESGIGKSRLVREFERRLTLDKLVFLHGRCLDRESVPYKAIDSLIDELSAVWNKLPSIDASYILPQDPYLLSTAFPVLEGVIEVGRSIEGPEIADPQERRSRCLAALRETMQRLARRRPVVLFLDDLQWVDSETVALLRSLMHEPQPPPLLLLMTARPMGKGTELTQLLAEWGPRCEMLTLGPLSTADSIRFVQSSASATIDADTVRDADGSPFLLEELGVWLHTGVGQRVAVRELLANRLAGLSAQQKAMLNALSLAGQPLGVDALCVLAKASRDAVLRDLAALTAARVTRAAAGSDGGHEPYHDRIREAAVHSLSEFERVQLHDQLARCLADADPAPDGACAWHYAAAGKRDEAARHAIVAGHSANDEFAFVLAAEWFRLALDNLDDSAPERPEVLVAWADALANAADGLAAGEAYLEAAACAAHRLRAIELRRRAAEEFLRIGHLDRGIDVLREVLAAQGLKYPTSVRAAIAGTVAHRAWLRLRRLRFTMRREQDLDPELLTKIDTCWTVASVFGFVDPWPANLYQVKHLRLALAAGEPYRASRALACEGGVCGSAGSAPTMTKRMMECLSHAHELAHASKRPHALGIAQLFESMGALFRGQWERTQNCAARAHRIFRGQCVGVAWEIASAQLHWLVSAFFAGNVQIMRERIPVWLREARQRRDLFQRSVLQSGLPSFYWLVVDRPERARELVAEAIEPWSNRGFHLQHYFAVWAEGHINQYERNTDAALARWQAQWSALEKSRIQHVQFVRISSHDARARCALTTALAGHAEAASVAKADARTIEKERMPWGNALALMLQASLSALEGSRESAMRLLVRAIAASAAAGMSMHKICCELRVAQVREDAAALAAARAWLCEQGVVRPDRIADVILPWPRPGA